MLGRSDGLEGVGQDLGAVVVGGERHHRQLDLGARLDLLGVGDREAALDAHHVTELHEADATRLFFGDRSFDAAVAMFLITVVPDPEAVLAEMARVVRPGGRIVLANHFSAEGGPRAAFEKWLSRFSASLGWNPEFPIERVLGNRDMRVLERRRLQPLGLYTLIVFERV